MNEIIALMKKHSSVRQFTEEKIKDHEIREMIEAGQAAGNWKNFQSYSIIVVSSQEKKEAIFSVNEGWQQAIKNCSHFLVFVGDLKRAETAVKMNGGDFQPEGLESILISSVDASLAAENVLLAAESIGYAGVMIGLIRDRSQELSEILNLPDYTYPLFGLALGKASRVNEVKPRLPYEALVFSEEYQVQSEEVLKAYDKVQEDYAAARREGDSWSSRFVGQWGRPENPSSTENLKKKKLWK